MMIQHTMNVTSCGGSMTQHNDIMWGYESAYNE